jgi:hypothetical protein
MWISVEVAKLMVSWRFSQLIDLALLLSFRMNILCKNNWIVWKSSIGFQSKLGLMAALVCLFQFAASAQLSNSLGMWGKSWGGFNALQVAALNPPALKCIITVCSTDDRYTGMLKFDCVVSLLILR